MSANTDIGHSDNFPPHPKPRCPTCRFWVKVDGFQNPIEGLVEWGECRRYPPHPWMIGEPGDDYDLDTGSWPVTTNNGWCGEWDGKK